MFVWRNLYEFEVVLDDSLFVVRGGELIVFRIKWEVLNEVKINI